VGKFAQLAREKESDGTDSVVKEEERREDGIYRLRMLEYQEKKKKKRCRDSLLVELRCSPAEPH
jgi:hypothetical protein